MSSLQTESVQRFASRLDLVDDFLDRLNTLEYGILEIEVNDHLFTVNGKQTGGSARIEILRFPEFLKKLYLKGDLGFAESYIAGDWRTPDLSALLYLLAKNRHRFIRVRKTSRLANLTNRIYHWVHRNTRHGSAKNIKAHYDLGNDFYKLWLDPGMTYSCALFQTQEQSLAEAQDNKYRRILDLLNPQPGSKVLEIGCGWGGFAVAAARRGIQVDGITLSPSQLKWAQNRIERENMTGLVNLSLTDYRDIKGEYDHIVSIEMFEAVGEAYWSDYMAKLHRHLKPGGSAALQVITIEEGAFGNYRTKPDFIQRYIFPGGMLPSRSALVSTAAKHNLTLLRDDNFGLDYAKTLRHWQNRFNHVRKQVQAQGFDERFLRMWRYYLSYCEAGFLAGRIDLHQIVLRENT